MLPGNEAHWPTCHICICHPSGVDVDSGDNEEKKYASSPNMALQNSIPSSTTYSVASAIVTALNLFVIFNLYIFIAAYACNTSTWEVGTEDREFKANQDSIAQGLD